MKVRKFYPRSAIRPLAGREFATLSQGEVAALRYVMRRSRKMGVQVAVASTNIPPFDSVPPETFAQVILQANQVVQFPSGI